MHKNFILCLIILMGPGISVATSQWLQMDRNNGIETGWVLSDIRKMTVHQGSFHIERVGGILEDHPLVEIKTLTFEPLDITLNEATTVYHPASLEIYPNPAHELLNIRLPAEHNSGGLIEIFSMEGRRVFSRVIHTGESEFSVNIASLPKGLYIFKYTSGKQIVSNLFVKQ